MAYTEFCCRDGGNNLNSGSVDGGATEPATTPLVTYTGGNWDAATDIYTAAAGADMTQAVVGRFASLYHDGDANPTTNQYLVGRITVVNAGTRQITISPTARSLMGTEVATGTANRSMRIGGAWKGPSTTFGFPFNAIVGTLTNVGLDTLRINFKNDASYVISAAMTHAQLGPTVFQGYTTTYGDLGKAIIDGGVAGTSYVLFGFTGNGADRCLIADFIFQNNGATLTAAGVQISDQRNIALRCVVRNVRGAGFDNTGNAIECEAYACNQGGASNVGGFVIGASGFLQRCISHHHSGATGHGFYTQSVQNTLLNCISANNGGSGLLSNTVTSLKIIGCDFYANGVDGWRHLTGNISVRVENSNFIGNTGYGINISTGSSRGFFLNNGFGSNTTNPKNNTGFTEEIGTVTYPAGQTPWVAPATGDFTINHDNAKGAGRGEFTQEYASWTTPNTAGKPDIGAAQHEDTGGGGGGGIVGMVGS